MKFFSDKVFPEKVLELLGNTIFPEDIVYMAGSLTEGFGNDLSDIDVYVICEHLPEKSAFTSDDSILIKQQCLVRNIIVEDIRYDIEYWTTTDFVKTISKLNNLNFCTEDYIERLSNLEYDLLHRFKHAVPINNQKKFYELHSTTQFENLGFYQVIIQSEIFSGLLEDIEGALSSKDYGSVFIMSRRLIDHVMISYLAAHGETNPNPKWLYKKMMRYQSKTKDEKLLKKYFELQAYFFSENTIKEYARNVLNFCQDLNLKAQSMLKFKQIRNAKI